MHQTKNGNQYYFGMKAHIGVHDDSGLVNSVIGTAANVADVTQVDKLLHANSRMSALTLAIQVSKSALSTKAARSSGRLPLAAVPTPLGKRSLLGRVIRQIEKTKAQTRAKVEHPFRVIKCQFGCAKVRFRGLAKNTAQLVTLFALSDLWMMRKRLRVAGGVCP